jgi:hypothetical protein
MNRDELRAAQAPLKAERYWLVFQTLAQPSRLSARIV